MTVPGIQPTVGWGCSACVLNGDGNLWVCTEACDRAEVHAYASKAESDEAMDDWLHENDLDAGVKP